MKIFRANLDFGKKMIKTWASQTPPLVGTESQVFFSPKIQLKAPLILILDINHLLLLISDDRGQAEHPEEGEQKENLEKQGQNRPDAHHPYAEALSNCKCEVSSLIYDLVIELVVAWMVFLKQNIRVVCLETS